MQLVTHTGHQTDGAVQCGNIIYFDYLYYLLSTRLYGPHLPALVVTVLATSPVFVLGN